MSELSSPPRIIVTGASSIIGQFLLPKLATSGCEVHAISRNNRSGLIATEKNLFWHSSDISDPEQLPRLSANALVHLAPLWLLPPLLPVLDSLQLKRVIGFGSTSVFSKAGSVNPDERRLSVRLTEAEEEVSKLCATFGINWTVFRPTLVYDCVRDKNITRIASFIRRFGFFPLLGEGRGLRQPVHADDLANACILALWRPQTFNRAYNLSGGEALSYLQMVAKIFDALGKPARFLTVPEWLFHAAIKLVRLLPGGRGLNAEMATRMNVDLCFNHSEATRDFDFSPRLFLPHWDHADTMQK
ncbi:NAD-dependent epimerase/dehydratase family protein [Nitrosospira sp. Is2]|uniref:NAD-dependent epimerase/dehydratase family protein n=1 Tax=Nitrosospira sp. Is2 TaxID=3080532 RepID=UPI0029537B39|nr:NAD-dependent epimerase/dehydratase family protein [Nitrosospira sp. Is2]WON72797.1 NAD-dependent epimerase/dehydratase family protein [Nitrosospira sp. Is2]